jgi:hypothetical protein
MKKHSAMTFYKSIPGIIIDPDMEELVEEPVVEEPVVEEPVVEEPVVEEPVVPAYQFEITLKRFKIEKATILRRFTNSLKQASTKQAIAAVLELQSSINIIADKFAIKAEKFKPVEPVEAVETVEPVGGVVVKKLYKLKYKEGVTAAMVDEAFLEKLKGLNVEEPKKKKVVKKKFDGASTSHT